MPPRPFLSVCLAATLAACAPAQRPERTYDLIHVKWNLSFDEPRAMILGQVTNTVRPLRDGTTEVWFDSGKLAVRDVTVNGLATRFETRGERLFVTLPRAARRRDTLKVAIAYSGVPEAGVYFIPAARAFPSTTGIIYTQGEAEDTRYWLPTYDFPDDKATSEGTLTVHEGQFALSNGKLLGVTRMGPKGERLATYRWRMDQPHATYLISFVVGNLSRGRESWAGIPIDWYVPRGLERMGRSSFAGTDKMVEFFSRQTGFKYPFAKFSQAVVPDFMFGGMENITQVTNTITTLHPPEAKPLTSSEGLVAHELAHQWFGDIVTTRDWSHIWINEGFASFLPAFWTRHRHGQEAYDLARHDTFEGGLGAFRGDPRAMIKTDFKEPMDVFSGHAYAGGAMRLFVLMHELGERRFWNGIREYLHRYAYKSVTTEQFFDSMSRSTLRDLRPFMQQWFYTAGVPRLKVTREGDEVVIVQRDPFFRLNLPVWTLDGSTWRKQTVHLDDSEVRVRVGSRGPTLIDPEVRYPLEIDYPSYTPNDWTALYQNAPNAAQKAKLLVPLFRALSASRGAALARGETSPRLLERMVGLLKQPPVPYLLELTRHSDKRVQNTAVSALESARADRFAIERLREIWRTDPNPVLRGTALSALLRHAGDEALAGEAWRTPSYNDRYRQLALGWWVARNPEVARERALEALRNPPSEPVRVAANPSPGPAEGPPVGARVFDALIEIAKEPSFGARVAAINALTAYGNPEALPTLRGSPATACATSAARRSERWRRWKSGLEANRTREQLGA